MLSLKDSLAVLKKTKALLEGHFVLSSGLHSPQYVQCAKLLSYPKKSEKFCKSLSTKIKKKFKKINISNIKELFYNWCGCFNTNWIYITKVRFRLRMF